MSEDSQEINPPEGETHEEPRKNDTGFPNSLNRQKYATQGGGKPYGIPQTLEKFQGAATETPLQGSPSLDERITGAEPLATETFVKHDPVPSPSIDKPRTDAPSSAFDPNTMVGDPLRKLGFDPQATRPPQQPRDTKPKP